MASAALVAGSPLAAFAQQPPAWSPSAFVPAPVISATPGIPRNSLREKSIPDTQEVTRWRTPKEAVNEEPTKSAAQAFSKPIAVVRDSDPGFRPVSSAKSTSTDPNIDNRDTRPRSSFDLNAAKPQTNATHAATSQVTLASHAAEAVPSSQAHSHGVWYDRASGDASGELVLGAASGNSKAKSTSSRDSQSPSENNSIRRVRYQQPNTDSALGIPPLNLPSAQPPEAAAPIMPNLPDAIQQTNPLNAEPPRIPDANRPGRSLLEPEQVVPNPFPGSRTPKTDNTSPSDELEPPAMRLRDDDDRAPAPPRRMDRSSVDCDVIRKMAKETDIRKVKVDSSPVFGEGIQDERNRPRNTKEDFVANAPSRNWYNHDGNVVATGKLVDLEYGMVIIEKEDGTRTSHLMRKLSDYDQAYVAQSWSVPITCSIDDGSFPSRDFTETTMTWKASGACHKPLYFEDVQLERYGHEWGPVAQPVISTLHFFGNVAVLPYKMGIHPMNECQYSLGYYRPGSCAPWTVGPVPLSLQGALMQAKVVTGAALALP
jgi:hypothetical protein